MTRKVPSWITGFFESTANLPSPEIFRTWTGIALVAGAMERKVWIRSFGDNFYPNLYTLLVAPPGVGKSVLTSRARRYWAELGTHHLAPASLTKASLIDSLNEAARHLIMTKQVPPVVTFNSLLVSADEFSVFLTQYDNDFMGVMNHVYDCYPYSERRRGKDININIEAPQLNLLSGTQPSYLKDLLPEGAWDQGFTSRLILIYNGESQLRDPLAEHTAAIIDPDLAHDLKLIGSMFGKMSFTAETASALKDWHLGGGAPAPEHPKLHHYNTRRTAHVLKLCMVAKASRSDTTLIELEDFQTALNWLMEAERQMPDIFKAMTTGGDARVIEEAWHYAFQMFAREKKPLIESRLVSFLAERTPAHNVMRILDVMVKAGIIQLEVVNKVGNCYVPRQKRRLE